MFLDKYCNYKIKTTPTDVRRQLVVSSLGNIKYSRTKFWSMPELWFLEYTLNFTFSKQCLCKHGNFVKTRIYHAHEDEELTIYPARSVSR